MQTEQNNKLVVLKSGAFYDLWKLKMVKGLQLFWLFYICTLYIIRVEESQIVLKNEINVWPKPTLDYFKTNHDLLKIIRNKIKTHIRLFLCGELIGQESELIRYKVRFTDT